MPEIACVWHSNNPNPRQGIKTRQALVPFLAIDERIRITQILVRGLKPIQAAIIKEYGDTIRITQILVRGLKRIGSRLCGCSVAFIRITQILVRGLKPTQAAIS